VPFARHRVWMLHAWFAPREAGATRRYLRSTPVMV
jgi:hypothetical protein